jgi:hypothetical protein
MISTETSKDIVVNGTRVTCYSDGSVNVHSPRSKGRTYGYNHKKGYKCTGWGKKKYLVHSLIAQAFLGERPDGLSVDHIDGRKDNNDPSNLRYVTGSQNQRGYRKIGGVSKYRGVYLRKSTKRWCAQANTKSNGSVRGYHIGYFDSEKEAAIARDTYCYKKLNYPLEGLNFPDLFVDKEDTVEQLDSMIEREENIERIQTQIEMIRQESRILSYRIDRMMEQRKYLSDEKRKLKALLETLSI